MKVKVIGKRYVCKKNAENKTYRKGTVIHTLYKDERVDGMAVISFWIDAKVCSPYEITLNQEYLIEEVSLRSGRYVVKCEGVGDVK